MRETDGGESGRERYRFGDYLVIPSLRELRRAGAPVHIQPKPFDLLLYLIRHRDRVVPRAELERRVWSDVSVGEEALSYALHGVRRAVGDDGNRQCVVQTVPRAGFRFVAPVEVLTEAALAPRRTAFVGRSQLLVDARALVDDALEGRRRHLLLDGEPGIGKTFAAEEIARQAQQRGFGVFVGRCAEVAGAPAFWPWVQIVREFAREAEPSAALQRLCDDAPEIARMVPELADRTPALPAPPADSRAARFHLFDAVARFLFEASEEAPRLLLIDDLHRADRPSMLLLQHLCQETREGRLVVVGTFRDGELQADALQAASVAAIARSEASRSVSLAGLSTAEVGELIKQSLGREPSAEVASDLRGQTNGNPWFLQQLLQVLDREGRGLDVESAEPLEIALPDQVQSVIRRQLDALAPNCVDVLRVAAVIGREFDSRVLERASDLPRETVLERLDAAIRGGIVLEADDRHGEYRFEHVLVRDALYRETDVRLRADLHARVGRALEGLWGTEDGARSASLAHHFYEASRVGEAERALRYAVMAGAWACERIAYEEAPAFYRRALRLLDQVEPGDSARRCEILIALGDAQTKAGDRDGARDTLGQAARLAKKAGLPEAMATAALRFAPDFLSIETGVYDPALVKLLEDALALLDPVDGVTRARLLARLAVALHWDDGSERRRADLADQAVAMAERLGQPGCLSYARTARLLALYSIEDPEQYLDADPGPLDPGDEPIALLRQLLRITSLLILGRVAEVDAEIETFSILANELKQPQVTWYADLLKATRAQMKGRFARARLLADSFLENAKVVNDRNAIHSYVCQMLMTSLEVGGAANYESTMKDLVEEFPRLSGWRGGLALLYSELGRQEEARSQLEWLRTARALDGGQRNEWFAIATAMSVAAEILGDEEVARDLYARLLPHSDHLVVVGYSSYCMGSVQYLLGLLAAVIGEDGLACQHFEKALVVNQFVDAQPWLARTLLAYAKLLDELRGAEDRVKQLLEKCLALCEALEMNALARKARLFEAARRKD